MTDGELIVGLDLAVKRMSAASNAMTEAWASADIVSTELPELGEIDRAGDIALRVVTVFMEVSSPHLSSISADSMGEAWYRELLTLVDEGERRRLEEAVALMHIEDDL